MVRLCTSSLTLGNSSEERVHLQGRETQVQETGSVRLWGLTMESWCLFGENKASRKQETKLGSSSLSKTLKL